MFYKVAEHVLGTCAGTLVTSKPYLQLPDPHRVVGGQKASVRFQDAFPSQARAYAKHMFSPNPDIAGNEKVDEASVVFVE